MLVALIIIFIFGLAVGSFLNVLVDRLPKGESVIKGRSHCEKCKKTLKWYDLIPLFSFLMLKGKCRYCHTHLSVYYLVIEFMTGLMFVLAFIFVSQNSIEYEVLSPSVWDLFYYLFIVSSLIVVFFADLKYGIIPDKIVFPAIIVAIVYLFFISYLSTINYLLSAAGACLFFLFLFLVTKGKGMGFGDVKFSFLMGLILGFPKIAIALYTAFLTGALLGCILVIWKRKKVLGTRIPFGPFLVFGTVLALFLGEKLIEKISRVLLPW